MLAVNTSTSESTGHTPAFLTQGSLYDKETLGTGRATETPEKNANKLREVFDIVRRNSSNTSRAVQTYTVASGDSIRNATDELL